MGAPRARPQPGAAEVDGRPGAACVLRGQASLAGRARRRRQRISMKKQLMAKHQDEGWRPDGRADEQEEDGAGKGASACEQGAGPEKWAVRVQDQSAAPPRTIPAAHGAAPPPHEHARAFAAGAASVRHPPAGPPFSPAPSSLSPLDAFLSKGTGPLAAQLVAAGKLHPASLSPGGVDAKRDGAAQQPPEPTAEPKHVASMRSDRDAENSPRGSGVNGSSGSSAGVSTASLQPHGAHRLLPSVPKVAKDGDAKSKAPELKGLAVPPAPAAKNSQKSPEAHKDVREHWAGVGPLRGVLGANSPRSSPKLSPKLPVSGTDGAKQAKVVKTEGKAEARTNGSPLGTKPEREQHEREQLERPSHDGAHRDKGDASGKPDTHNKSSSQWAAAATTEEKKASREGKQKTSKGAGASSEDKGKDNILVGIGERIKNRTKSSPPLRGGDDDDSEEDVKEEAKRRRRRQRTSSSEEEEEEDEDEEKDGSGVPPLEAKISQVKGAWFDIELLASDTSVRVRAQACTSTCVRARCRRADRACLQG